MEYGVIRSRTVLPVIVKNVANRHERGNRAGGHGVGFGGGFKRVADRVEMGKGVKDPFSCLTDLGNTGCVIHNRPKSVGCHNNTDQQIGADVNSR